MRLYNKPEEDSMREQGQIISVFLAQHVDVMFYFINWGLWKLKLEATKQTFISIIIRRPDD